MRFHEITSEAITPSKATLDKVAAFHRAIKQKYPTLDGFNIYLHRDGSLRLGSLYVKDGERKQGIGSSVMQDVCEFADSVGATLTLHTAMKSRATGTTSRSRLLRFYKRFGFVETKGQDTTADMIRRPSIG